MRIFYDPYNIVGIPLGVGCCKPITAIRVCVEFFPYKLQKDFTQYFRFVGLTICALIVCQSVSHATILYVSMKERKTFIYDNDKLGQKEIP